MVCGCRRPVGFKEWLSVQSSVLSFLGVANVTGILWLDNFQRIAFVLLALTEAVQTEVTELYRGGSLTLVASRSGGC